MIAGAKIGVMEGPKGETKPASAVANKAQVVAVESESTDDKPLKGGWGPWGGGWGGCQCCATVCCTLFGLIGIGMSPKPRDCIGIIDPVDTIVQNTTFSYTRGKQGRDLWYKNKLTDDDAMDTYRVRKFNYVSYVRLRNFISSLQLRGACADSRPELIILIFLKTLESR